MDGFQERLLYLILALPAYVTGFTLHEFAHAYVATKLGDDTAQRAGKLSLDPLKMLDPMGSLLLVVTILLGLPLLGFAYVPITPSNFRNPHLDHAKVAIAGPLANFAQAVVWAGLLLGLVSAARLSGHTFSTETVLNAINRRADFSSLWNTFACVCSIGVVLNISLGAFNLLPIPPFDGGTIAESLIPPLRPLYNAIRPMSFFIIFLLIQAGPVLNAVFRPIDSFASGVVLRAFGRDPGDYGYRD